MLDFIEFYIVTIVHKKLNVNKILKFENFSGV